MASTQPLVSIVTPSYNQAEFLRETMESVFAQDYPRIEYLVIDGGSTDGSVELIREYETRLAYWQSAPDKGQAHAINTGWRRAGGEFIGYLNSDDTLEPNAVSASVEALLANPAAGFAYGNCAWIDEHGDCIGMMQAAPFTFGELLLQNRVPQPTALARRAHVERAGWLDEHFHWMMDYDLWLRLALHSPAAYVGETLASFRLHDKSKTGSRYQDFLRDHLGVIEKIFAEPEFPRELEGLRARAVNHAYFETATQCYSLGLHDAGNAVMQDCFRVLENPLEYREDIVSLFANHMVHIAPLRSGVGNALSGREEEVWLEAVLKRLPTAAAGLRPLKCEILARVHVIHAFDGRARGAWHETRAHLAEAVRFQPGLLKQRGIASLLAQGVARKVRPVPASNK